MLCSHASGGLMFRRSKPPEGEFQCLLTNYVCNRTYRELPHRPLTAVRGPRTCWANSRSRYHFPSTCLRRWSAPLRVEGEPFGPRGNHFLRRSPPTKGRESQRWLEKKSDRSKPVTNSGVGLVDGRSNHVKPLQAYTPHGGPQ